MPRKTLTALLPVTLPTDESAYGSLMAATLLANVSEISKAVGNAWILLNNSLMVRVKSVTKKTQSHNVFFLAKSVLANNCSIITTCSISKEKETQTFN